MESHWSTESDSKQKAEKLPKVVVLDSAKTVPIVWSYVWLLLSDGAHPGSGQIQYSARMRPGAVPYCLEGSEQMVAWCWAAARLNHSNGRRRCQKEKEKLTAIHLVCLFLKGGKVQFLIFVSCIVLGKKFCFISHLPFWNTLCWTRTAFRIWLINIVYKRNTGIGFYSWGTEITAKKSWKYLASESSADERNLEVFFWKS